MLTHISLNNVRNISSQAFHPSSGLNLIYGKNGSGKTSILEAVYLLGRGRSFRTHLLKQLVSTNEQSLMVVGKVLADNPEQTATIGISYDKKTKSKIRVNGRNIKTAADLAKHFPLLFIGSDIGRLLSSGERQRRRCLDWGLFHVEPTFLSLWKRYNNALKQRNASLKSNSQKLTSAWNLELGLSGSEISKMRGDYVRKLKPFFFDYLKKLLGSSIEVTRLSFEQGWPESIPLMEYLQDHYFRDAQIGYTQRGPHRADIKVDIEHGSLANFGSGGQQKLVTCALLLSQIALYKSMVPRQCVVLVDDLPSELDLELRRKFIDLLLSLDSQVFITGTELELFDLQAPGGKKMFHVEQGKIKEQVMQV